MAAYLSITDPSAVIIEVRERGGRFCVKYSARLPRLASLLRWDAETINKLIAGDLVYSTDSIFQRAN